MKEIHRKILRAVYQFPTMGLTYREISRISGVSVASVSTQIEELEIKRLIEIDERKHGKLVTGNHENREFIERKRIDNIEQLYESGLVDFLEEKYHPSCIILFGSFEKGQDTERSDIDICVVSKSNYHYFNEKFYSMLQREINITKITKTSREFYTTIANGFVLRGYLSEYRRLSEKKNHKKMPG